MWPVRCLQARYPVLLKHPWPLPFVVGRTDSFLWVVVTQCVFSSCLFPSLSHSLCLAVCCGDGRTLVGLLNELCGCADKSMIKSNDINNVMYLLVLSLTRSVSLSLPPPTPLLPFMPPWVFDFALHHKLCFYLFMFVIICIFYLCHLFLSIGLSIR